MLAPEELEELIRRCARGDESALTELVHGYQDGIFQFLLRVSGDPDVAEEVAGECFFKVWSKAAQWKGTGNGEAWIYRLAHRSMLDFLRRRKRWWNRLRQAAQSEQVQADPLDLLEANEEQERQLSELQTALNTLDEQDKAIVHLYYYDERSLAEVAAIIEISQDAAKMRLMRIRKRLAGLLKENHD